MLILVSTGCATTLKGPIYKPADITPGDKAIIYLYWTDTADENAKKIEYMIQANKKYVTQMVYGGYYQIICAPETDFEDVEISSHVTFKPMIVGILDIPLAPTNKLTLSVQRGKVYFVRCNFTGTPGFPYTYGLSMRLIPDEKIANHDISEAKLLPEYVATKQNEMKEN